MGYSKEYWNECRKIEQRFWRKIRRKMKKLPPDEAYDLWAWACNYFWRYAVANLL